MFEHSVKVPRHYKIAANIFKKVSTEGGSVKTLLYDDKLRHFRTNVLFALITETIKHAADIDKIIEHCQLLVHEPRFDPWLAKVLTAELLFGKKSLPGKSKPEQTILSYKEQFEQYASEHPDALRTEETPRPRYVRINTNLLTTSDAIRAFHDEGYRFIRCTSGPYADYLEQIQKLTECEFTQDYHVKTIFVFAPGTKWHNHELYLGNQIILQDKATALAVHLLAPPPGSVVLDMCAAPGMKTTQLAAYLRNNGKIYAVERNDQRYQTLCDFVERTSSRCVHTYRNDSLDIKKGEFEDVEYILLDPSCSGSGMTMSVHNYAPDNDRLEKLTSLQEKFLKHAMNSFPKAKRIVYSTCSLYPEENERVIANVVRTSRSKWRVQDTKELLKGQWNNFGSAMYGSTGTRCLYAKPDLDLTTGFFLAVLDRDQKELAKIYRQEEKEASDLQKRTKTKDKVKVDVSEFARILNAATSKNDVIYDDVSEDEAVIDLDDALEKKKKKKDKQKRNYNQFKVDNNQDLEEMEIEEVPKKKKKKDKHSEDVNISLEDGNVEYSETLHKKRKRKDKGILLDQNSQSSLSSIIKNLEHLNVEEPGMEEPKSKKQKKDKSVIETANAHDDENFDLYQEKEKSKKKKKRKIDEKNSEIIEESAVYANSEIAHNNLKTKKKKSKSQDLNDEC